MIRFDTEAQEIVFATEFEEFRFPLLSLHVCPHCGLVLAAGFMTDDPVPVHGYEEPSAVTLEASRYFTKHVGTAQLIARNKHARDDIRAGRVGDGGCPYLAYTFDDLAFNVRSLLFEEAGVNVPADQIDPAQLPTDASGLRLVPDAIGRLGPVLLFDPDEYAGPWRFKIESWETYWRRRQDALMHLVTLLVRPAGALVGPPATEEEGV